MKSPLDPFLDRDATPEDMRVMSAAELRELIDAANDVEALTSDGVRETQEWARAIRTMANQALETRHAE